MNIYHQAKIIAAEKFITTWSRPASRLWLLGNIVCLSGYLFAVCGAFKEGLVSEEWAGSGLSCFACERQLNGRSKQISDTDILIVQSEERKKLLIASLVNQTSSSFTSARDAIAAEEKYAIDLRKTRDRLSVTKVATTFPFDWFLIAFVSSFSWWIGTKINAEGEQIVGVANKLTGTYNRIICFAFFLLAIQLTEDIFTSIFAEHKNRFHWTTFCISLWTYVGIKFYFFGLYLMTGYGLLFPYWFGSTNTMDQHLKMISLDDPDGQCGMSAYLRLVEKMTVMGFGGGLIPLYIALSFTVHSQFVWWYVLTPTIEFMLLVILVFRLVRNVYRIRAEYESVRQKFGSWSVQSAAKLPADPTIGFLGSQWWNLPAGVLAIFTVGWLLLDYLGLRSFLFPMLPTK